LPSYQKLTSRSRTFNWVATEDYCLEFVNNARYKVEKAR